VKFRVRLELSCETKEDVPGHNVVGELRGRERPDEIVLVGGHLDAWDVGQGAHDDGAGCCQAIAAVALLKKLGLRPRRTIRVVLFTNEENGTRGGKAYAKAYEKELGKHVFALESDRGGFTPRGFSTNANPKALAVLRELAEPLRPLGIEFVPLRRRGRRHRTDGSGRRRARRYVPDGQRYFDLHHSAKDTLSEVHPRELELGTAAIARSSTRSRTGRSPCPGIRRNRNAEATRPRGSILIGHAFPTPRHRLASRGLRHHAGPRARRRSRARTARGAAPGGISRLSRRSALDRRATGRRRTGPSPISPPASRRRATRFARRSSSRRSRSGHDRPAARST
jgi:hypothetical protein